MSSANRSLGLAALGWWLAARGLSEPINESFTRLDPAGVQRLGKASRLAALVAARRLAHALREEPGYGGGGDLFVGSNAWLDRLDTVLNAPRVSLRLEKALTGDSDDFDALIEVGLIEDRSLMLAARLAEWLHAQVGGTDEPAALATFLAQGWPLAPGAERRITFVQEFLANLQTELSDAPSEITMPLGAPEEFLEWLEGEAGHAPATTAPAAKPLDLPPPTPPATPAPPIEALAAEPVVLEKAEPHPDEPEPHPDEEPPHPDESYEEVVHAKEVTTPSAQQHAEALAEAEIYEGAAKEHRRLRSWALLLQLGWVAAIILGWRLYQEHRAKSPVRAQLSATPSPAPSPVVNLAPPPASPRLSVKPPPTGASLMPAPPPLKPEMSVAPGDLYSQALALAAAEHHAEAVALFRRIVQLQAQDKSLGRLPRALVYARMASSLAALERWDEADASVERSQALLEELLPTHDAETALGVGMVADYWASRERWPLAARLYQKAVQAYEDTPAENSLEQLSTVNRLAGALRQIGEMTRAEQLYRQLVKAYAGAGSVVATDAASASHNLANVLLVTNRAGEALKYYEDAFAWLAKASPTDEQARRMAVMMQASYERCLSTTGIPPEEARERSLKAMPPGAKEAPR